MKLRSCSPITFALLSIVFLLTDDEMMTINQRLPILQLSASLGHMFLRISLRRLQIMEQVWCIHRVVVANLEGVYCGCRRIGSSSTKSLKRKFRLSHRDSKFG